MKSELLLFTYADKRYSIFALPYAYFALRNNANAIVEIMLEDLAGFRTRYAGGIQQLEQLFPGRARFTQSALALSATKIVPNTLRFVEQAASRARFLYIGDIDILVFDDVQGIHESLIRRHSLPFSNVLRKGATRVPRLTGLHFCAYDDYYPLPDIADLDLAVRNDENVLYEIMHRKGLMVPESFNVRPECGIHMSLSRDPLGRTTGTRAGIFTTDSSLGWGGSMYFPAFMQQIREPGFLTLYPDLDFEFKALLLMQEAIAAGQERVLHRVSAGYFLDKRLTQTAGPVDRRELMGSINEAAEAGHVDEALVLARQAVMLWPRHPPAWKAYAEVLRRAELPQLAVEADCHLSDLRGHSPVRRSLPRKT